MSISPRTTSDMCTPTILLLLSASALLVQGGSIPSASSNPIGETTAVDVANNGFSVKTGYEGYIATVDRQQTSSPDFLAYLGSFYKSDVFAKIAILKDGLMVVKRLLLPLAVKLLAIAKVSSIVLLWGIVATSIVCKFTSLCSFSMNLPDIKKKEIQEQIVNYARPYMSEDTLNYTLKIVRSALDQYNAVQDSL